MRRSSGAAVLVVACVFAPSVVLAQTVPACVPSTGGGGILTGLAHQFSTTTGPWTATALGYAQGLFFLLVAIEIAWSGITYVLQKDSLPDFVASLLLKILSVGFFYILIQPQYGPVWIADIVASFTQAGSAIGGQPQLGPSDPSSVFGCGTDIANAMLQSISQNNVGLGLGNILPAIEAVAAALLCALGVVIAFAIVAGQLLITLIESYIVIGAGVFMLGFTGSRWTLVFGEKYVGYAFSVGIKLFMLELIVGLGYGLGQKWAALFANGLAPPETYLEVVGAALIFGFVAWQIPGLAAALMNGSPRMTLGSFLNTAGTAAVGGVVLGSGVAGMLPGSGRTAASSDALRAAASPGPGGTSAGVEPVATAATSRNGRAGRSVSEGFAAESAAPGPDLGGEARYASTTTATLLDEDEPEHPSSEEGAVAVEPRVDGPHDDAARSQDREPAPAEAPANSTANTDNDDATAATRDTTAAEVAQSTEDAEAMRQADTSVSDSGTRAGAESANKPADAPDGTEASVTADEAAQTRASDETIAAEDARMAQRAERVDVQGTPPGALPARPPVNPGQALRQPPVPDDSAEGSIHIRFKHPE